MNTPSIKKLYFKDTSFASLMNHRIYNVLLFASRYDAFILEEDGRIDEQIFNEYTSLNLRYPPRFTLVTSEEEANKALQERTFELIISMPSGDNVNPYMWAKRVKVQNPNIPIVLLTPFSRTVIKIISNEDLSGIDFVFSWLGNSDILLAIIKLIEDRMNIDGDVKSVGVQVILFVEDSTRFYSSIIPRLYKFVFKQSHSFMTEALNEHEQMLRMRGRPKIVLARSYEEAMYYYNKYSKNMLGVITDVSYKQNGVENKFAGINLCREIREIDSFIPLIIESSDITNKSLADEVKAAFLDKMSKTFFIDLRQLISDNFGFGDFLFIDPDTREVEACAENLKDLQDLIFKISDKSLYYHVSRNNISRWLYSRAMFPLAEFLKGIHVDSFEKTDMPRVREIIFDAIVKYRKVKNRGIVAVFDPKRFDRYSNFARIGDGSMGGKGRGLAFIDAMIKRHGDLENFENVQITIPRTVVVCADFFTDFMESNALYAVGLSDLSDEEILKHFLKGELSGKVISDLRAFIQTVSRPLAVRSSSLLEDSNYQPFAGIYSTYMVPYDADNTENVVQMLVRAIKAVYASVFYKASKSYMKVTQNVIDEEKMAIILQEICGGAHGNRFYPSFSGVARSLNYYPIGAERSEEGIANVALGLGKYIVDGGLSLRFSPSHPQSVLQTSTVELAIRETQNYFYALDLNLKTFEPQVDDSFNLTKISVQDAVNDGTLKYIASTYNLREQYIHDNANGEGRKLITFANILKHNVFPLAQLLKQVLNIAHDEMGRPVEIEFAVNLDYSPNPNHTFYLLQVRPIVDTKETITTDIGLIDEHNAIISSKSALGHGIIDDIFDIIYIRPESFNAANNVSLVNEIEQLNNKLAAENRNYILVGPGRWGSSDSWLGIPVKWQHISNVRVMVESGLPNYRIEPSQGTHFFQNLTSLGVFYFTINPFCNDGRFDIDFLNAQPAIYESEALRHIRFPAPIVAKADGRKSEGLVLKPI